jgi:hypothetical protein
MAQGAEYEFNYDQLFANAHSGMSRRHGLFRGPRAVMPRAAAGVLVSVTVCECRFVYGNRDMGASTVYLFHYLYTWHTALTMIR